MARRGVPKVLRVRAKNAGLFPGHHRLYDDPRPHAFAMPLDDLWKNAESAIPRIDAVLQHVEQEHRLPSASFVVDLVPYVAHLLARPPRLDLEIYKLTWPDPPEDIPSFSDLTDDSSELNEHERRLGFFAVLADVLLFNTHWSIALAPRAAPWITTDLGMAYLPGEGIGTFVIPLTPQHAVVLTGTAPTYRFGVRRVSIRTHDWSADDVRLVNDFSAMAAPFEVYALDEDAAGHVLEIWEDPDRAVKHGSGLSAQMLLPLATTSGARMLNSGREYEPRRAGLRFLTAHHEFGCGCEKALDDFPEYARENVRRGLERGLAEARKELRQTRRFEVVAPNSPQGVFVDRGRIVSATARGWRVTAPKLSASNTQIRDGCRSDRAAGVAFGLGESTTRR